MPEKSTPFPVQATKPKVTAEKPDFTSPSTGKLLSAISKADTSTAIYAGKAFEIATGLVAVFEIGLTLSVKSFMGLIFTRIRPAHEEDEKRLQKAYNESGFPFWMQIALREMEAEVEVERRKRELDTKRNSR
ncbi:hypothetical protein BDQ12DRAFT_727588 [Crucibulum laeve]|uniref:Uncharacterized protein n=1 Tax=Crucibulum laeve TaxID=68775 RepID=A0A5C3LMU8_9AGAR|nr:hypothetical protein BDQ12DRAFT_727588 [Crucibulum laeve]